MTDNMVLETFRQRLKKEDGPALYREIEAACLERRDEKGVHRDWALLCEEAGLVNLSFRERQLALRDDPLDEESAFRLAVMYRERGDATRAVRLLEDLVSRRPTEMERLELLVQVLCEDGGVPRAGEVIARAKEAGLDAEAVRRLERYPASRVREGEEVSLEPEIELVPTDADLMRFQGLFAGREDVHARQWAKKGGAAGYTPVREPMTPTVVRNHFLGTYTVGVYPIRLDGTCTFFAIDLDINRAQLERARTDGALARRLRELLRVQGPRLLEQLTQMGLPAVFEDSGYKGRHYWVFLQQPETAEVVHQLGRMVTAVLGAELPGELHLEFFPKQAGVQSDGLGNLIKIPLGIHRRTGRRGLFLDATGKPVADQLGVLRQVQRLSREDLYAVITSLKTRADGVPIPAVQAKPPEPANVPTGPKPLEPIPAWTEADFEADPRMSHLLQHCPVLAELKRQVDEHRRLSHDEQLVLIHSLGHLSGGPQAVNYLLSRCVDTAPEKMLKSALRGNPVSCPSIRKKIGHLTRRVACNCRFEHAPDRYPTPVLHLLGMPEKPPVRQATPGVDVQQLARRYAVLNRKYHEVKQEWEQMQRALVEVLQGLPDRAVSCPGGRYRLIEEEGVEELRWEEEKAGEAETPSS